MSKISKRAYFDIFKTGILCPEKYRLIEMVQDQKNYLSNSNRVHWKAL
jgi:hypothetical protein